MLFCISFFSFSSAADGACDALDGVGCVHGAREVGAEGAGRFVRSGLTVG